jgi:hypothetical protein
MARPDITNVTDLHPDEEMALSPILDATELVRLIAVRDRAFEEFRRLSDLARDAENVAYTARDAVFREREKLLAPLDPLSFPMSFTPPLWKGAA